MRVSQQFQTHLHPLRVVACTVLLRTQKFHITSAGLNTFDILQVEFPDVLTLSSDPYHQLFDLNAMFVLIADVLLRLDHLFLLVGTLFYLQGGVFEVAMSVKDPIENVEVEDVAHLATPVEKKLVKVVHKQHLVYFLGQLD